MISRPRYLGLWMGLLVVGLSGCGPALAPTPAKVDNSRCRITSLAFDSTQQTGDTIRLKAGSQVLMKVEGETVGIYCFPSQKGPSIMPRPGSKMDGKIRLLSMTLRTSLVRAGSNGEDVEEMYVHSDGPSDALVECDERSFSLEQDFQVPGRTGNYEFRITGYWMSEDLWTGEHKVDLGIQYTPDSHVLGTWKAIVE